jgi:hypothetical protein
MRANMSILALLLLAATSRADPCQGAEPATRSAIRQLTTLASDAAAAAVRCGIHGADAGLVAKLRAEQSAVARAKQGVVKWPGCMLGPLGIGVSEWLEDEARFAGELGDEAVALCSPGVAPVPDDHCVEVERWMRGLEELMENAAARATDSAVTCAFHGVDDRALAGLAHETKPRIQKLFGTVPQVKCAGFAGSPQAIVEAESKATGERVGFAFAMCSTTVRTRARELARTQAVTQDVVANDPVCTKAIGTYMDAFGFGEN